MPKVAAARTMGKPAAKPSPSRKPAAKPVATGKVAARKRAVVEAPIKHISPEEAVAHIQALLEAKQERVRQGPSWPGAEITHPNPGDNDVHEATPAGAGGLSSEAAFGHALAHERGDQSKRKG
ncbi:MAG TPA: hypothetical protein VIM06_03625 [Rhodanobacter sp.]